MTTATPTAPCLHCGALLEYRAPRPDEPFGASGRAGASWVHADTGATYVGACHCDGSDYVIGMLIKDPHPYSHTPSGELACPTWRDDHCATPRRS